MPEVLSRAQSRRLPEPIRLQDSQETTRSCTEKEKKTQSFDFDIASLLYLADYCVFSKSAISWMFCLIFLFLGRGIVYVPEDNSSDCEGDEETDDSISRGLGITVTTDPLNVKFEVFTTTIREFRRKQCVVGCLS